MVITTSVKDYFQSFDSMDYLRYRPTSKTKQVCVDCFIDLRILFLHILVSII